MHEFLIVFEYIDESVFKTINSLKYHLDIACKGNYTLTVAFNSQVNGLSKIYQLLGAPALVNLKTNHIIYGNFFEKDFLKHIL